MVGESVGMEERPIVTPETHPDHEIVGKKFKRYDGQVFYCDSYDPRIGFWMTPEGDGERRNVSERAIGTNFRRVYDFTKIN